jgi:UDP-N-acetylmuramyl tripeptide synthase
VLMNLFRDQLDRYGELETLVDRWDELLDDVARGPNAPTLVLNADDPNVAELGRGRPNVIWFGVDDTSHALASRAHAADATTCRRCGSPLEHSVVLLGHLGHWACTSCDAARPTPDVSATKVELTAARGQVVDVRLPNGTSMHIESALPGLHNAYNLTAAAATDLAIAARTKRSTDPGTAARAIGATKAVFGRGETVMVGDKSIRLLLAKNPTGVNQNVRTLMDEPDQAHVLVMLNDRTADGQDVSWIWDVDWEPLEDRVLSLTLGGERSADLALRFRYGGFDMTKIGVYDDVAAALDAALECTKPGQTLHALPTYTAMLDLRAVLTERGYTSPFWVDA